MGLLLHGSYLAGQEERLSLAGDSDSAAQPPHQHPSATLPRSQLQALYGFAGKGTA